MKDSPPRAFWDFRAKLIHMQIPSGTGRLGLKLFRAGKQSKDKKTQQRCVLLQRRQPGSRYVTVGTGVKAVIE